MAQTGPFRAQLLTTATAGESLAFDVSSYGFLTFYVKTNGTPTAGTVVLEEADWNPQTDPATGLAWSTIATVTLTSDVGDSSQYAYHVGGPGGSFSFAFVRARIGTSVTGTTIDVTLRAV